MDKIVLSVEGMSCSHCENAIMKAVGSIDGVSEVTVDLKSRSVIIEYDVLKVPQDHFKQVIEEQGYEVK